MDIGLVEKIVLVGKKRIKVRALFDTGAQRTSIDKKFAERVGLEERKKIVRVKSTHGKSKRKTAIAKLKIKGKIFKTIVNLTDRENMRYKVLIGRDVIYGNFKIDLEKTPAEFMEGLLPKKKNKI